MKEEWLDESRPGLSRRRFLEKLSAAGAATMLGGAPQVVRGEKIDHPEATADACIFTLDGGRDGGS